MKDEIPGERDELYLKAVEFGESLGEVSISSIQRRLKIGHNRAGIDGRRRLRRTATGSREAEGVFKEKEIKK